MPAVLHLAGERAWWLPRWLDRMVPRVDIEGDHLDHRDPLDPLDPLGGSSAHPPVSIA